MLKSKCQWTLDLVHGDYYYQRVDSDGNAYLRFVIRASPTNSYVAITSAVAWYKGTPSELPIQFGTLRTVLDKTLNRSEQPMSIEGIIEMASLGRSFRPGMLYDCRSDQIIPSETLWDNETLKRYCDKRSKVSSSFEVMADDCFKSKALNLDIEGDVKLSIIGGLIKVSGSAEYLHDRKSSKKQSRVSLRYRSTARYEQLTMDQLGNIQYKDVLSKGIATHLVSAVLYGADAIFVFDQLEDSHVAAHGVQGELEGMVQELACFMNGKAKGEMKIGKASHDVTKMLKCTFHGDVKPPGIPTTFSEAVDLMKNFPQLLSDQDYVPKMVFLYPLSKLNDKAVKIVNSISISLVTKAENIIEELIDCEIRCNDIFRAQGRMRFKGLIEQVERFKDMVMQFKPNISQKLAKILPSIRGGKSEISQLSDIFQLKESSPFNSESLTSWLSLREDESEIFKTYIECLAAVKSIMFINTKAELTALTMKNEIVVSLCFQLIKSPDRMLQEMQAFLYAENPASHVQENESWSNDDKLMETFQKKVVQFRNFVKANMNNEKVIFIATEHIGRSSEVGVSVKLYKESILQEFCLPTKPREIKLQEKGVSSSSISIKWLPPDNGACYVTKYNVTYCPELEINKEGIIETTGNETNITIKSLKATTTYTVKVCAMTEAGMSDSSENYRFTTSGQSYRVPPPLQCKVQRGSGLPIYKIKGEQMVLDKKLRLHKVFVGIPSSTVNTKVLMVVGATGAGKTTLINGLINYILGVKWSTFLRLKLIEETSRSQAHSQTKSITAYTIFTMEGSCIDYNLTIIDTPGFGDTSGLKRDREIIDQIKQFFSSQSGIAHLNGIGFVTQSSLARLTPSQKYIFDSILSIFGKDVEKNIFIMATFADGKKAQVMSAIKEAKIPYSRLYKFNNSALFAGCEDNDVDDGDTDFNELFWDMGMKSFKHFFTDFENADSVSLVLTKDVLEQRERLEIIVESLQNKIRECLCEIDVLHQERRVLEEHEKDIETNKEFTYEIKVSFYEEIEIPEGKHVTNCMRCSSTCHFPCRIEKDSDKMRCAAMKSNRDDAKCNVCNGGCAWHMHRNTGIRFELNHRVEKRTLEDLKQKFEKATEEKEKTENWLASHQQHLEEEHAKIHEMIVEARQCLLKLDEIALKPNPLTQEDYIQLLIQTERNEATEGWMDRIEYLQRVKKQAALLSAMKNVKNIDSRITEISEEGEDGWEVKVEALCEVKKIMTEVESIKKKRSEEGKGYWEYWDSFKGAMHSSYKTLTTYGLPAIAASPHLIEYTSDSSESDTDT